ncbi:MAG: hypothetical protein WCD43_09145 [Candidatus Acidiferrales bacterium]
MAQPGKAPTAGPSLQVAITYNPSKDEWKADPPNGPAGATVNNQGQVTFHGVPSGGCRVYTSPAGTFVNETNGYEQLSQGNNVYTLASGVDDSNISYCVCGPTETCTAASPRATGGYSIKVGNPGEGDERK